MSNQEQFFSRRVPEPEGGRNSAEQKRIEEYARFLNLPVITGVTNEVWGEAWQSWLSGKLKDNVAPGLENPPPGFEAFIESKGYSFKTGEPLAQSE